MKRDQDRESSRADLTLDRQIERLAPRLRDEGIAPARDLWPGIDAAIRHTETEPRRGRRLALWRVAALAASVLLLVGVGWIQWQDLPDETALPRAGTDSGSQEPLRLAAHDDTVTDQGLRVVDDALAELTRAQEADPDNPGLSKLILMIHKSRGNLIRDAARQLTVPGR